MAEVKWFAKSKTIWGGILALVPVAPAMMTAIGLGAYADLVNVFAETGDAVIGALGAVLVFVGRIKAKTKLTATPASAETDA